MAEAEQQIEKAPTLAELGADESAADTMRAVFDEYQAVDEGGETVSGDETISGDVRPRDPETGRFVPKEAEAEGEAAPEGEPPASETVTPEPEADQVIEPPHEWSADQQDAFRKLEDPKLRQFVLDTVNASQEGIQASQRYKALDGVIAEHRDSWARQGLDDAGGIRRQLNLWKWAVENPVEFRDYFVRSSKQAGVVFPDEAQPTTDDGEEQYIDPELQARDEEIAALRARLDNVEGTFQIQNKRSEAAQQQQLWNEVVQFKDERDPNGKLLHPYFEELRQEMRGLTLGNPKLSLQELYDRACYANPEVRRKIASAEQSVQEQERRRQDRAKAEAAQRAGASISGDTPGAGGAPPPSDDIFQDMRNQAREAGLL